MPRLVLGLALAAFALGAPPLALPTLAMAAGKEPVANLTPAQQQMMKDSSYDCDHEGSFGCLKADCRAKTFGADDAAEVRYLYRDTWTSFPEFLTPALRACFVRAGGTFK